MKAVRRDRDLLAGLVLAAALLSGCASPGPSAPGDGWEGAQAGIPVCCADVGRALLAGLPGVERAEADFGPAGESVLVRYDPGRVSLEDLIAALSTAGLLRGPGE